MRHIIKGLSTVLLAVAVIAAIALIVTKYMDIFARPYYMLKKSFTRRPPEKDEPFPADACCEACCYEEE